MKPVMPWKPVLCEICSTSPSCWSCTLPKVCNWDVPIFLSKPPVYSHKTLPQTTLPKLSYWMKSSWFTLPKEPKLLPLPYAGDQWHQDISGFSQDFGKFGTTAGIWWSDGKRLARTTVMPWKSGRVCGRPARQTGDHICWVGCHTPLLYL